MADTAPPATAAEISEIAQLLAPAPGANSPPQQSVFSSGPVYSPPLPGAAPPAWYSNPLTMRYISVLLIGAILITHQGCDLYSSGLGFMGGIALPADHLAKSIGLIH